MDSLASVMMMSTASCSAEGLLRQVDAPDKLGLFCGMKLTIVCVCVFYIQNSMLPHL